MQNEYRTFRELEAGYSKMSWKEELKETIGGIAFMILLVGAAYVYFSILGE